MYVLITKHSLSSNKNQIPVPKFQKIDYTENPDNQTDNIELESDYMDLSSQPNHFSQFVFT